LDSLCTAKGCRLLRVVAIARAFITVATAFMAAAMLSSGAVDAAQIAILLALAASIVVGLLTLQALARIITGVRESMPWLVPTMLLIGLGLLVEGLSVPMLIDAMDGSARSGTRDGLDTNQSVASGVGALALVGLFFGLRRVTVVAGASGSRAELTRVGLVTTGGHRRRRAGSVPPRSAVSAAATRREFARRRAVNRGARDVVPLARRARAEPGTARFFVSCRSYSSRDVADDLRRSRGGAGTRGAGHRGLSAGVRSIRGRSSVRT
jgi:hypothetical protein